MTRSTRPIRQSLAGLATAALVFHAALCAAQTPLPRPQAAPPIQAQITRSPPNVASVLEASARSAPLIPQAPLVASALATLLPLKTNYACFPASSTYQPNGLLPQGGFSSSPTTPYPQATWAASTNPNLVINYVIQRAVLNTTSWTTVATTCGGPPSIWHGYNTGGVGQFRDMPIIFFVDSSGGLLPATAYVYKVIAVDQNNRTDWSSFQWTSQPVLPTVQVTNYQRSGSTITFTAAQFYNLAGQMVDSASRFVVQPNNAPAFRVDGGNSGSCDRGSYGLVCQVKMDISKGKPAAVSLTFQWGFDYPDGFHVLAQSGIKMPTP
jgi:hypothetical protein